mgnify:CR=1 FL=1
MVVDVNTARTEFSLYKENLIKNGALREIYQGEKATVYSLADIGYGIVIFAEKPAPGNSFDVLLCVLDEVEQYISNENILYEMMKHKVEVSKDAFIFNDKFDKRLEALNQRRIETGFSRIDRAKEEEMLASFGLKK